MRRMRTLLGRRVLSQSRLAGNCRLRRAATTPNDIFALFRPAEPECRSFPARSPQVALYDSDQLGFSLPRTHMLKNCDPPP
jgi:hypothetical protein